MPEEEQSASTPEETKDLLKSLGLDKIIAEARQKDMVNKKYSVLVEPFAYGQKRISLCMFRTRMVPDPDNTEEIEGIKTIALGKEMEEYYSVSPYAPEGHSDIHQQLDTYHTDIALKVLEALKTSKDPERLADQFRKPWNSEGYGDRIRLDNRPEKRPELEVNPWDLHYIEEKGGRKFCLYCVCSLDSEEIKSQMSAKYIDCPQCETRLYKPPEQIIIEDIPKWGNNPEFGSITYNGVDPDSPLM